MNLLPSLFFLPIANHVFHLWNANRSHRYEILSLSREKTSFIATKENFLQRAKQSSNLRRFYLSPFFISKHARTRFDQFRGKVGRVIRFFEKIERGWSDLERQGGRKIFHLHEETECFFSRLPFFEERQLYTQSLLTDGRRINRNPGEGRDKGERQIDCDSEARGRQ